MDTRLIMWYMGKTLNTSNYLINVRQHNRPGYDFKENTVHCLPPVYWRLLITWLGLVSNSSHGESVWLPPWHNVSVQLSIKASMHDAFSGIIYECQILELYFIVQFHSEFLIDMTIWLDNHYIHPCCQTLKVWNKLLYKFSSYYLILFIYKGRVILMDLLNAYLNQCMW